MEQAKKRYYTAEEYLAREEASDYKSEFYKGEIFAMTGASINHNRIVTNVTAALYSALRDSKCETFMSYMRIWVEAKELFTYPDISVVCDKPKFYKDR
ncbi:Uma2 family endonuclease [candidate division KSB1 bacterium]|nr:Uma2 family endonuclease [candidate division KSB1 bacterium]NIR72125.1 Uma2 family endonuclease [candidate division KSB1 bacterium]NIS24362.1 Uma2 family endonuclease [candidate division KSB1 bacterium]NIT71294.1 Uma2 family endonuclease [candidate division KSB1 bacterium]NIU24995.1 Uma2 family endonuclease [candidate division KSB1 bacterium]